MRAVSPKRAAQNRLYDLVRLGVLERDAHACIVCGLVGGDVHHRKQRSLGGSDDPVNLITLCRLDHSEVHDDDTGLFKPLGYLMASWETESQVPVWHNLFGSWALPYQNGWDLIPPGAAKHLPSEPVEQLRLWLDDRARLFTVVHNAIPEGES